MSNERSTHKLFGVQMLRGAAALIVVVAHFVEHGVHLSHEGAIARSALFGVIVFFAISGFVIFLPFGDRAFSPGTFVVKRVFRVVPLYWASTMLVAMAAILTPSLFKNTEYDALDLFRSLFFIPYEQPAGSGDWRPLHKPGWTLNYEMFFYTLTLLTFWCKTERARLLIISTILISFVLAGSASTRHGLIGGFYGQPITLAFVGGVACASAWKRGALDGVAWRGRWLILALSVLFVAISLAAPTSVLAAAVGMFPIIAAILLVICCLVWEPHITDVRALTWLGDISYSAYLLHMFVVGVTWALLRRVFGLDASMIVTAFGITAGIALTMFVSHLSFRYFEQPVNRLGHKLARRSA
jgi:peptidoglycan/LPS O-acetylase OafA/YrhL